MGFFRILAAIPGFFVSSLIFMALWGVFAPGPRDGKDRLSHGYVDNHHPLACRGASGGGDQQEKTRLAEGRQSRLRKPMLRLVSTAMLPLK